MIRVLYLIDRMEGAVAGTERHILRVLDNMDRRRVDPQLFTLQASDWTRAPTARMRVGTLGVERVRSARFVRAIARLASHCRREGVHAIQTFFPDAEVLGALAGRLAGCRVIIASRRNLGYWQRPSDVTALRALRHVTTHTLANSQAAVERAVEVEGISPTRADVIYNGVDAAYFEPRSLTIRRSIRAELGLGPHGLLVGCVANLRPVKNLDMLVEAATRLGLQQPEVHYVVIGEGELRGRLERRVAAEGLQGRFHFVGHQSDVRPYLASMDIAVLTSDSEGFSTAICEYMATGLPVVATDVGGNGEAVVDGQTGFLVPRGDAEALAERIEVLIADGRLREAFGQTARTLAKERYSLAACIRAHEAYYERTVGSARKRR